MKPVSALLKLPSIGLVLLLFWVGPQKIGWAEEEVNLDIRSSISIVFGLGLGGAILGLSTLSFDQYPERNLDKISKGAAIGIIAGVLFSVYLNSEKTLSKASGGGGGAKAQLLPQNWGLNSPLQVADNFTPSEKKIKWALLPDLLLQPGGAPGTGANLIPGATLMMRWLD